MLYKDFNNFTKRNLKVIKNNFIVITGGPGGGKSTLLKALEERGYRSIEETARMIIKERLSEGLSPRPEPDEFAKVIYHRDYENFINNLNVTEPIFFDRSFMDSALMVYIADMEYYKMIRQFIKSSRYNEKVFITPPWEEIFCQDDERDQTFEEAKEIYKELYNWYELNGYEVKVLPKDSVENRIEFIVSELHIPQVKADSKV